MLAVLLGPGFELLVEINSEQVKERAKIKVREIIQILRLTEGWRLGERLNHLRNLIGLFEQSEPGALRQEYLLSRRKPSGLCVIEPPMRYGNVRRALDRCHRHTV